MGVLASRGAERVVVARRARETAVFVQKEKHYCKAPLYLRSSQLHLHTSSSSLLTMQTIVSVYLAPQLSLARQTTWPKSPSHNQSRHKKNESINDAKPSCQHFNVPQKPDLMTLDLQDGTMRSRCRDRAEGSQGNSFSPGQLGFALEGFTY